MATTRTPIPPGVERRIRREARSATLRELALLRRREGWTLAAIGVALGVSVTRVHQILRKAERLNREGIPAPGAPSPDPNDPLARAANTDEQRQCYPPTAT
jgi:Sigma-70, region 4